MKKNNLLSFASIASIVLLNTGCSVFQIGESEFACSGKPDGSICKGPMEVYELTNNRDNLDHLMISREKREEIIEHNEDHNHPVGFIHEDGSTEDHDKETVYQQNRSAQGFQSVDKQDVNIYEQRNLKRQDANNYQQAALIAPSNDGTLHEEAELSQLRQSGLSPSDIAPEALAALTPPKVLRILIFPWNDAAKNLHLQGYIYKKIEDERWIVGNQVNRATTRVLPRQMVVRSQENINQQKTESKGVDPINVQRLSTFTELGLK
jgi:conjugal transfer pilus assembly protein TraV